MYTIRVYAIAATGSIICHFEPSNALEHLCFGNKAELPLTKYFPE